MMLSRICVVVLCLTKTRPVVVEFIAANVILLLSGANVKPVGSDCLQ